MRSGKLVKNSVGKVADKFVRKMWESFHNNYYKDIFHINDGRFTRNLCKEWKVLLMVLHIGSPLIKPSFYTFSTELITTITKY